MPYDTVADDAGYVIRENSRQVAWCAAGDVADRIASALEAEEAGRYSRKVKYHRDPWALAAHWRLTWPVRDYLRTLSKHLRHLDDFTLELADGTTLTGDEAKAYVRRYA